MRRARHACVSLIVFVLVTWFAPLGLADECPERIDEANALLREAEQTLAQAGTTANRAALQEKLTAAKALVDEALTLHNANEHDASVEKAYGALAGVKEVLRALKP